VPFITIAADDFDGTDVEYAERRRADRTYMSRSFADVSNAGAPARLVYKVFDPTEDMEVERVEDTTQWVLHTSPTGRVQVKVLVSGEPGNVTRVTFQRVKNLASGTRLDTLFTLSDEAAQTLVTLMRVAAYVPVDGEPRLRVDDALIQEVFESPESLGRLYEQDPAAFRRLISDDDAARDLVATQRRRTEVERFRRMLEDRAYFAECSAQAGGDEDAWQAFFEDNPWILGTGLGGQLFTSWSDAKLQQIVAGSSIGDVGKRADALMRTSGVVRWMTFAEFKTHETPLLAGRYRSGTYPPSADLVGGVAQSHATVRLALKALGDVIRGTAADGSELPDDLTLMTRPRSFLLIGSLTQLVGDGGGLNMSKAHSFELFRRALTEPEVVTYDELLARAEWLVQTAEDG